MENKNRKIIYINKNYRQSIKLNSHKKEQRKTQGNERTNKCKNLYENIITLKKVISDLLKANTDFLYKLQIQRGKLWTRTT